jgi:hypothetical protein
MDVRKLLTVELSPQGDEIDIHMNREGLNDFIKYLHNLAEGHLPLPCHNHLMTPAWAGNELTDEKQSENGAVINKVTLRLWR